jgi:hypothetical protein
VPDGTYLAGITTVSSSGVESAETLSDPITLPVPVPPTPTLNIVFAPAVPDPGEDVMATWTSNDVAFSIDDVVKGASGSEAIATAGVTALPLPTGSLIAGSTSLTWPQGTTLYWATSGGVATLDDGTGPDLIAATGSRWITPQIADSTYTLKVVNGVNPDFTQVLHVYTAGIGVVPGILPTSIKPQASFPDSY